MSQDEKTFEGQCYCGAVKIVVTGDPVGAGYCHCAACRSWSAGPVNAFTLWKPEAVAVTQGEDHIGEYHKNERSYRQWCKVCGGHLLTRHPQWDLVDVYAATIPSFPFAAGSARQLRVDRAAHEGRPAEAEGLPRGAGRLRRDAGRVATRPAGNPDGSPEHHRSSSGHSGRSLERRRQGRGGGVSAGDARGDHCHAQGLASCE